MVSLEYSFEIWYRLYHCQVSILFIGCSCHPPHSPRISLFVGLPGRKAVTGSGYKTGPNKLDLDPSRIASTTESPRGSTALSRVSILAR